MIDMNKVPGWGGKGTGGGMDGFGYSPDLPKTGALDWTDPGGGPLIGGYGQKGWGQGSGGGMDTFGYSPDLPNNPGGGGMDGYGYSPDLPTGPGGVPSGRGTGGGYDGYGYSPDLPTGPGGGGGGSYVGSDGILYVNGSSGSTNNNTGGTSGGWVNGVYRDWGPGGGGYYGGQPVGGKDFGGMGGGYSPDLPNGGQPIGGGMDGYGYSPDLPNGGQPQGGYQYSYSPDLPKRSFPPQIQNAGGFSPYRQFMPGGAQQMGQQQYNPMGQIGRFGRPDLGICQ